MLTFTGLHLSEEIFPVGNDRKLRKQLMTQDIRPQAVGHAVQLQVGHGRGLSNCRCLVEIKRCICFVKVAFAQAEEVVKRHF
ncbi:hypothetical protein D3C85_913410 [compost metagenome]